MAKKTSKSGNKITVLILLLVVAFVAMACGFFYANSNKDKDVMDKKQKGEEPKEISLLDESIESQRLVDTILLQKNNWQLVENKHEQTVELVEESGTTVKINQRDLRVGVPLTTSLTGAADWLKTKVEGAGLVYMGGEATKYKNWDAYQAEVGIKVKAGEGTKSFMTDKITFIHNGNLTKEDKDVKNLPEEQPKEKKEPKPARQYSGKLAIVVDDCGADTASVRTLLNTGLPFSYAILPDKQYSSDVLAMIKAAGRVPMLHLPMEPMNKSAMSEGSRTITVDLPASEKLAKTKRALASLPGVQGVNNHQGSRATSDKETMKIVIRELKRQGVFFVDSKTIGNTVARDTAKQMGVPTAMNDIFLDNSTNVEEIRAQVYKAMEIAEKNGSCIAICHARVNTAAMWKKYAAEFKNSGVEFVHVTELLY